jgi:tetratricopeptide (TPR) repeat protein
VLSRFLRALGLSPNAIPRNADEASALFRSLTADRRFLVLLDNAADAAQVRPLLPAHHGCVVLVTSRHVLVGLDGSLSLHLDVLPADDAVRLLGRVAGHQRTASEPAATLAVARLCGFLPLALRIAAARLAARPTWPIDAMAVRLADAKRRLDELELAEAGVRASFAVSYAQLRASADALDRAAARAFGMLGVMDGPDIRPATVSRLLDVPRDAAERALERLVEEHLLESPLPDQYRLHDLLRLYAREIAGEHQSDQAFGRALGWYAASVRRTLAILRPGDYRLTRIGEDPGTDGESFADAQAAVEWLEAERQNLVAAVEQAARMPDAPLAAAIRVAQGLFGFFWVRSYHDDWVRVSRTALAMSRRLGDRAAEAQAHNDLGTAYSREGRYGDATSHLQRSLELRRELGDRRGQAASMNNLGLLCERQDRLDEALRWHEDSLAIARQLGDLRGQAASLGNLGSINLSRQDEQGALDCLAGSLKLYEELGDRRGQATTLDDLGMLYHRLGCHDDALACLRRCIDICEALGERHIKGHGLHDIGVVYRDLSMPQEALTHFTESLAIRRELGDTRGVAETSRELQALVDAG